MSDRLPHTVVRVPFKGTGFRDWESFWDACSVAFRFGSYFGRNKDAWYECMAELDHPVRDDGSSPFPKDCLILIDYPGRALDRTVSAEIVSFLVQGCARVNAERDQEGETPMLICLEREPG